MSYLYESQLDPAHRQPSAPAAKPRWILLGYLLGLIAMSPAPLLYYWLLAPGSAVLIAAVCGLIGATRPRLRAMASGALIAAAFGATAALTFYIALANQS